MRRSIPYYLLAGALVFAAGCQPQADSTAQIQQLESRVQSLEKKVEELSASQSGQGTSASAGTASPTPAVAATPETASTHSTTASDGNSGELWKILKYDSLPSPKTLEEVASLGFLPKAGITDQKTFEGELTRGQYVALLVEMNNLLAEDTVQIRLARDGDGQAFDDVPPSHPYYKYIQGMVTAGYVIGFNEKTFQPDKLLTREEMVAIAAKREYNFEGFDAAYHWEHYMPLVDKGDIAPKYREAVSKDYYEQERSNLRQAFGELKTFHPKKNVRAYEAVLSLQGVGDYSSYKYDEVVGKAMGKK